jgi:hypothetical protein
MQTHTFFIHFPFQKRVAAGLSDPAQSSFSGNGDVPENSSLFMYQVGGK